MRSITHLVMLPRVMESPWSPKIAELVEQHLVWSLIKQARLQRVLGEEDHGWSVDLDEDRLTLAPEAVYRVDVLGTDSANNDTFVWAWANPSFSEGQRKSALLLRRIGRERGIRELVEDGQLPLARMESSLACLIGVGVADADAYFVGEHEEGAVGFLLHDDALRGTPVVATDVAFGLNRLPLAPVDHRRAVDAFAAAPPEGFTVVPAETGVAFVTGESRIDLEFAEGRLAGVRSTLAGAAAAGGPPPADPPPGADPVDPEDTETIGVLDWPGGPIVVFDPLHVYPHGPPPPPLPGGLPVGEHDVDVALIEDRDGGRRVELAYVFVSAEEVVEWQEAGLVATDSGILCFGTPAASQHLADAGEPAIAELERVLDGNAAPTWTSTTAPGLVAVSVGLGAGEYTASWGYDADEELVCLMVDCLGGEDLEPVPGEPPAVSGSPGRGLQRSTLLPISTAGWDQRNVIILPTDVARRFASAVRRWIVAHRGEIDLRVVPEYEGEHQVPSRVVISGTAGGRPFEETVEVSVPTPPTAALTALLEETIVIGCVSEKRMERLLGPLEAWSCDLEDGVVRLGDHVFRVDIVGTESHTVDTFVWAWTDPSFRDEHTRSALELRRQGARMQIPEFLDDGEIPLERLNGDVAGFIACSAVRAEAHYLAVHDEGALVLLLHGPPLADAPLALTDLVFGLTRMASFAFPFDHRRAVEAFAEALPPGFEVEVGEVIVFRAAGGSVTVVFDELGRAADIRSEMPGGEGLIDAPDPAERPGEDDTRKIGALRLQHGEVVVCDPLTMLHEAQAAPLPGGVPSGTHDVDVWLVDDPAGGRRAQVAYLFFTEDDEDADDDVVDWQVVQVVACDSGLLCFATPAGAARLLSEGEAAVTELEAGLNEEDTWSYAVADDLVAFSAGFGAREYEVALGYDGARQLVCVMIDCLPPEDLERDPDLLPSVSGSPGQGLQRSFLLPAMLGGPFDPRNVVVLPPAAARDLVGRFRRLLRDGFDQALEVTCVPEFDDDSQVPARITMTGTWGPERVDEVVEVERP